MAQKTTAWLEQAIVTITEIGGTDYDYQTLTESIDIDLGDRDIEGVATLGGGRITKFTPEADTTITLECYALEATTPDDAATGAGRGFFGHFWNAAAADPQQMSALRTRLKHRIVILWTDNTSDSTAPIALDDVDKQALRFIASNGYVTSVKPSYTDDILKFTVTMKFPTYDKSGVACIRVESTEAANTLAALNSYTTTSKW